jgi:radical SAM protein with 4Fe4S-binding SPASM domain
MNPPEFLNGINAIVFLNYKPVGANASSSLLLKNSNYIEEFFALISKHDINRFKIGFDSCTVSGIVENLNINPNFIEACEAGRFSAFISENMRFYPCSFMVKNYDGEDLQNISLKEAWLNSIHFRAVRDKISSNECKNKCKYENLCKGGCPVYSEINICDNA